MTAPTTAADLNRKAPPVSVTTRSYVIQKMSKGQRRAMLAAIDTGGRLPADTPRRVLTSIPEEWVQTDQRTGLRWLTDAGRVALLPIDRFRYLKRTNPETGVVPSMDYAAGRGMSRDGLVIFRDRAGKPVDAVDRWIGGIAPYITPRGRKLVGMPLTAPAFSARFPLGSPALWRRAGQPDALVQISGWPMTDGTVRVWPRISNPMAVSNFAEHEAPVGEIRPAPRRVRGLPMPSPAGGPVHAARARLARTNSPAVRRRFPFMPTMALRGEWRPGVQEAAIREYGATAWRSGVYGRSVSRPSVALSALPHLR